jgi:hypothetical protein
LKGKARLSEGSKRKLKGNSGSMAAASEAYIRMSSGGSSERTNNYARQAKKAFRIGYSGNLIFVWR